MIIEKATDRFDLPHTSVITDKRAMLCECGRGDDHALHHVVELEKAGAQPAPLITEKGII